MPSASSTSRENNDQNKVTKTIALDGAAGNGAVGTIPLFTVTGHVILRIFGMVTESLVSAGGGSMSVGTAGNAAGALSAAAAANLAAGDVFVSGATPADIGQTSAFSLSINNGADLIATVTAGAITDGTITFYCLWRPLSDGSSIVAA